MNKEKLKEKIGADDIYDDGTFRLKDKFGILNLKTGEITKSPFADFIDDNGKFRIKNKWGVINLKTGKIIKEIK